MKIKHADKKVWLVEHPIHQYKEDVKTIAAQKNVRIIDAKYKSTVRHEMLADDMPSLTKKGAKQIKQEAEKAVSEANKQVTI